MNNNKSTSKTYFILTGIAAFSMALYIGFSFLPIINFYNTQYRIYDLCLNKNLFNGSPLILISVIATSISALLVIALPFGGMIKKVKKSSMMLLSCASLPLLAFSFTITCLILPIFEKNNVKIISETYNHGVIVAQCLCLAFSFLFLLIIIFYLSIKLYKPNIYERIKKKKQK